VGGDGRGTHRGGRPAGGPPPPPAGGGPHPPLFPGGPPPADTRRDKESPGHSDRGSRVYGVIWRKNELTPPDTPILSQGTNQARREARKHPARAAAWRGVNISRG